MTRLVVGIVTFLLGATLVWSSRREADSVPSWTPRLAWAVMALGLSTLAATQPAMAWSIVSIAFSVVAIALLLSVIRDTLRRR